MLLFLDAAACANGDATVIVGSIQPACTVLQLNRSFLRLRQTTVSYDHDDSHPHLGVWVVCSVAEV
jgi:hypothetical protein